MQRRQKEKDDVAQASTILRSPKAEKTQSSSKKREDLSRDDLLFLLSVLEGELQVIYCLILYSRVKHTPRPTNLLQTHAAFMLKKHPT